MATQGTATPQKRALTPIESLKMTTEGVQKSIDAYVDSGRLNLPINYSAGNALKQAQLMIQDDAKLMNCTQNSLAKAMLDCVILGLNPSKQQCYFIAYGDRAGLSISYQGKKNIAMRIDDNIADIVAAPIKDGEEFEFEDLIGNHSKVIRHQRNLKTMREQTKRIVTALKSGNIEQFNEVVEDIYIGGYATITYKDGTEPTSLIMMFDRIKQSWGQSTAKPLDENGNIKPSSTHAKFIDDMIMKTVITAICKPIINSSDDTSLYVATAQSNSLDVVNAEAQAEREELANTGPVIDVDFEDDSTLHDVHPQSTINNDFIEN